MAFEFANEPRWHDVTESALLLCKDENPDTVDGSSSRKQQLSDETMFLILLIFYFGGGISLTGRYRLIDGCDCE